jgi:predicted DsbA family dithiol-disulfide isomerase
VAGARWRWARDEGVPRAVSYGGAAVLAAALLLPLVGATRARPLPRAIGDEIARSPRGIVTVVDFVDFECPFCRVTQAELAPLLAQHPDRLRLVRRQVPLSIHPHARDAARAACCAELFGKGDSMASALFAAPVESLTREGCEQMAESVGLPLASYRACVADPATDARIESDRVEFKSAGGYALPTIWIDGEKLVGAQPREALERAIDSALARAGS